MRFDDLADPEREAEAPFRLLTEDGVCLFRFPTRALADLELAAQKAQAEDGGAGLRVEGPDTDPEGEWEVTTTQPGNGRSELVLVGSADYCHRRAKEIAGLPPETPDAEHYRGADYDGPRYREPGPLFSVRPHEE